MTCTSKRLRDTREDFDLTQSQIAAELKTTQQQYALYESGKRKLPIDKLIELSSFYGVSTDYLLGVSDKRTA